jgi:hypothetical protein
MLKAVLVCFAAGALRLAETAQASAGEIAYSAAEPPAWRGRSAQAAPPSGCADCDAFGSDEGFFAVTVDCLNRSLSAERRMQYLRDEEWVSTQLRGCLTALLSSLGRERPASFFRQDLPAQTIGSLPGVVIGRGTGAVVAGAHSLDADYWSTIHGRPVEQQRPCLNEESYAARRIAVTDPLCNAMQEGGTAHGGAMQAALETAGLDCRFSGLEVMAEQFAIYNRDSVCEGSWTQSPVRWEV